MSEFTEFPPETPTEAQAIMRFWFGDPAAQGYPARRREWFVKDASFDAEIRARFSDDYERVVAGDYEAWKDAPTPCLAYIVLTDQFPRNMFRESARAFATDARALAAAEHAVAQTYDALFPPIQRMFFYLPFEHAEDIVQQRRSLALFGELTRFAETGDALEWAARHHAIIERFGRFPHRNAALGRISTPEEIEFLKQPGSGF